MMNAEYSQIPMHFVRTDTLPRLKVILLIGVFYFEFVLYFVAVNYQITRDDTM